MAILDDPLFAEEARGQLAKVLVFKRSQVHPYVSSCFYHPVNWTPAKIQQALAWRALCQSWHELAPVLKSFWSSLAPGVLTGFNYYMQLSGVLPFPPPYEPPTWDNILFNFTIFPYTPPTHNNINFDIGTFLY